MELFHLLTGPESPSNWPEIFPKCVRDNSQSPINFDFAIIKPGQNFEEILFVDYDETPINETWKLMNNGHTGENEPTNVLHLNVT